MALTDFGKAVRKARIESEENLSTMAEKLGTTAAFLSGMETGRKKISQEWVEKISQFFEKAGHPIEDLGKLAAAANGVTTFNDRLSLQQKMLVAGFAQSPFSAAQLKRIAELFDELKQAQHKEKE
ncbi:helix-turn-helix transcriptional regulator [Advenella sp. EE-W14]|uniref:helix-turn-helix domain-containing protein n=1 Tax=Advenella sp. EE-W14 TaxID=2722705 RepID=UPI00145EA99E|nr:helix-turn-helix transcriptional regulator [Advenella sp. EE-W14]